MVCYFEVSKSEQSTGSNQNIQVTGKTTRSHACSVTVSGTCLNTDKRQRQKEHVNSSTGDVLGIRGRVTKTESPFQARLVMMAHPVVPAAGRWKQINYYTSTLN